MKIYECDNCGKIIFMVENKFVTPTICCGEEMKESKVHEVDMGKEKHVPCIKIKDDFAHIQVGEDLHPYEPTHYIKMILVEFDDSVYAKCLKPTDKPVVCIPLDKGKKIKRVYSYCNIHGWWKTECNPECK